MRARASLPIIVCTLAAAALAAPAQAATRTSATVDPVLKCAGATHCYEMNEDAGATVMRDSGTAPLLVDGHIGAEVHTGIAFDGFGTVGYKFDRLTPNTPPAHPEHVVTIPDRDSTGGTSATDPGNDDYTVTIRYRTTNKFGNLIQKGQSASKGGQFKIQLPVGRPSCYFKGSVARVGIGWPTAINDGQWHTLVCTRTATRVTFSVDGAKPRIKNGVSGLIDNNLDLSIAGKTNCDQIKTTCDYFGGDVDFVSIEKTPAP